MLSRLLPTPDDHTPDRVPMLRRNLFMHFMDGSFYVLGMSFVAVPTVYPVFIRELGGGSLAVGSVQVLWMLGLNIPAAFMALRMRRMPLFRGPMVYWSLIHRLMLLVSGTVAAVVVGRAAPEASVVLFLALLFFTAFFGSLAGLPWFQVYSKTVPVRLRGRLMGLRQLSGSAVAALGGYAVGLIIAAVPFPYNFSSLFFIGFAFTMVSFVFLMRVHEEPTVYPAAETEGRPDIVAEVTRILRKDRNFRRFLVTDALLLMSLSAASFYPIHAMERFALPPSAAGTFSAVVMVSSVAANIVFGAVADHAGHRTTLIIVALSASLAAFTAFAAPNVFLYGFVFMFLAAAIHTHAISRMPFVAEMADEHERPLYLGITNTLTSPALLTGVLWGLAVPFLGYAAVFIMTAVFGGASALLLRSTVVDPRHHTRKE